MSVDKLYICFTDESDFSYYAETDKTKVSNKASLVPFYTKCWSAQMLTL